MHILYIYPELVTKGGTDKMIIEKANYLVQHCYQVTIVTESQMGRQTAFPLDDRVKLIDMGLDFNEQYRYGSLRRLWIYLTLMRRYKRKLTEVLMAVKPDIAITAFGRNVNVLPYINDGSIKMGEAHTTKRNLRSLHLLEQRGGIYKYVAQYMRCKMERSVAHLKALVLLTPEDAADWRGVTQTHVILNPISSFPTEKATLDNRQVLMVGRYNDAKGYDYLVEAWQTVHRKHPDWTLHAYGSGELHDQVVGWIEKRRLQDSFILHEPVDNIMDKYLESSICVLSSRYEGFSLVILEAMASGVPLVSFDCPHGPRNIIRHEEDGLLVEYLNSQALADGICRLIEDEPLRKRLGANARKNIRRFSQESVMQQWEDLFNKLVKSKK